jgi:hypothetical protein
MGSVFDTIKEGGGIPEINSLDFLGEPSAFSRRKRYPPFSKMESGNGNSVCPWAVIGDKEWPWCVNLESIFRGVIPCSRCLTPTIMNRKVLKRNCGMLRPAFYPLLYIGFICI